MGFSLVLLRASSWTEVGFFDDFGFWKAEFSEVCNALCLLPETIHGKARCTASREQALMVLLRRWRDPRPWEALAACLRATRPWCIDIYSVTHKLLVQHYLPLLKVVDFKRVIGAAAGLFKPLPFCAGLCFSLTFLPGNSNLESGGANCCW